MFAIFGLSGREANSRLPVCLSLHVRYMLSILLDFQRSVFLARVRPINQMSNSVTMEVDFNVSIRGNRIERSKPRLGYSCLIHVERTDVD